jgi:hypothetical protein
LACNSSKNVRNILSRRIIDKNSKKNVPPNSEKLALKCSIINRGELEEIGRTHYFYHSPFSTLPIRDVSNGQGKGFKTEPHIEIGAENYVGPCRPTNIVAHLNRFEKYLFLVTRCANKRLVAKNEAYGKPYIVGYIEKDEELRVQGRRRAVKGKLFLFPFEESVPYYQIFSRFAPMRLINGRVTAKIKGKFPKFTEDERVTFLLRCVDEIKRLDKNNPGNKKTCFVLRGINCPYKKTCLRWNP